MWCLQVPWQAGWSAPTSQKGRHRTIERAAFPCGPARRVRTKYTEFRCGKSGWVKQRPTGGWRGRLESDQHTQECCRDKHPLCCCCAFGEKHGRQNCCEKWGQEPNDVGFSQRQVLNGKALRRRKRTRYKGPEPYAGMAATSRNMRVPPRSGSTASIIST